MTTMATWKRVDIDDLNKPRTTSIRGVSVTVYFGQDDMPMYLKGDFDQQRNKFVIVFRYDSESEPSRRLNYAPHVVLTVGQDSERLYEVELDVNAMNVQAVQLLGKVLDELSNKAPQVGLNRIDNYLAASGAFKQARGELETALVAK
jgi:hypothetical protein